jgi:hypothetical protein
MTDQVLRRVIATANIVPTYPGRAANGKYDRVPAPATAHLMAEHLKECIEKAAQRPTHILLAGRWTTTAWTGDPSPVPYFNDITDSVQHAVYTVPHPGGTNMQLNDQRLRAAYATFMRDLLTGADLWECDAWKLHRELGKV